VKFDNRFTISRPFSSRMCSSRRITPAVFSALLPFSTPMSVAWRSKDLRSAVVVHNPKPSVQGMDCFDERFEKALPAEAVEWRFSFTIAQGD
jgi:hypothetical protein